MQLKAPAGFKPAYTMERILKRNKHGEIEWRVPPVYLKDDTGERVKDHSGKDIMLSVGVPICVGVHLRRAKTKWNLSPDLIMKSQQEGWMKLEGDTLAVTHSEGVLRYKVIAPPGYYCCHCGAALSEGGTTAQLHVANHEAESPDPQNPSGYKRNNFYACELES